MAINVKKFEDEVFDIIHGLKRKGVNEKEFSDVIDEEGNQYVDLVQEGGGVLGIALVGYTYVLEQMGLRFYSLAGTSAGAINTLAIAAVGGFKDEKSKEILKLLCRKNFSEFIDGDSDCRDFVNYYLKNKPFGEMGFIEKTKLTGKGAQVVDSLLEKRGLNKGENFLEWMKELLADNGIFTNKDLTLKYSKTPSYLKNRDESKGKIKPPMLKIIASDITTETKAVFPEMADLYWENYEKINPAYFVRASMSIPVFFYPFEVSNISSDRSKWIERVKYFGKLPDKVTFVDGGMMSNFPIDEIHNPKKMPAKPTFGVKLGIDRSEPQKTGSIFSFIGSMFNASRHIMDYTFYLKNDDYSKIVKEIPMRGFDWLNFNLDEEEMLKMFRAGAEAAKEFLIEFDWKEYKNLRKEKYKLQC